MNVMVYTLICALAVIALMMLGLGIKMVCKKHGEFKRHCSSMDPYTGEGSGCVCGRAKSVHCSKTKVYSPLEVNDKMLGEL